MREVLQITGLIVMGVVGLIGMVVSVAAVGSSYSCSAMGAKMEIKSEFSLGLGCMAEIDGRWEPLSWQRSVRIKD